VGRVPSRAPGQDFELNEAFFHEHALIAVNRPSGFPSSDYNVLIDSIARTGDVLHINISMFLSSHFTISLSAEAECVLIKVGRDVISGINHFIPNVSNTVIRPYVPLSLQPMRVDSVITFSQHDDIGVEIPFRSSAVLGAGCLRVPDLWYGVKFAGATRNSYILRSPEELEAFRTATECRHSGCDVADYDRFNRDFFQENAVIAMFVTSSGQAINRVTLNGNTLHVSSDVQYVCSQTGAEVPTPGLQHREHQFHEHRYVLIEVDRESALAVTQVVYFINRQEVIV
jgi:hypothetical protein